VQLFSQLFGGDTIQIKQTFIGQHELEAAKFKIKPHEID